MLVIRDQQKESFKQTPLLDFEDRALEYLIKNYPKKYTFMGDSKSRLFVKNTINQSLSYDIRSEGHVMLLLDWKLQFGEQFEKSPDRKWIQDMLVKLQLPEKVRIESIIKRMTLKTQGRVLVSDEN